MSEISIIQNLNAMGLGAITPSQNMPKGSSHEILNILGARLVTNELLVNDLHETSDSILDTGFEMKNQDDCASKFDASIDDEVDRIDDKRSRHSCYRPNIGDKENLEVEPSVPSVYSQN